MSGDRIKIAYIGGGSARFGWRFMSELAAEEIKGTVSLYDIDKKQSLRNEVIGNKLREQSGCKSDIIYIAADNPEECLRDADFVILSISVGSIEDYISDLHLPEMYGIYQSFGENTGPSGIMRALRTLPVYADYARKIREFCPNAWVISLTNPMNVCLMTLYREFPQIKAFGSSSEPFSAAELAAEIVGKRLRVPSVHRREIKTNIIGINGFSFINEAFYSGEDIMPILADFAREHADGGYERRPEEFRLNPTACANKVRFDLFLRYGAMPTQTDRITAEFCPTWYLKTPKTATSWKFAQVNVNLVKKQFTERSARGKRLMDGEEALRIGGYTSDCVSQIKALLGMGNLITNACLPNSGQITNLPSYAVTETNALFAKNSIRPVAAGAMSEELYALTVRHTVNQKLIVDAVFEKDLDIAFNAFINDPLMSADLASAAELYKEMLSAEKNQLVYYLG